MHYHTWLIFVSLVEMGSHHVYQAALELLTSGDLPAIASQSAEITEGLLIKLLHESEKSLYYFQPIQSFFEIFRVVGYSSWCAVMNTGIRGHGVLLFYLRIW